MTVMNRAAFGIYTVFHELILNTFKVTSTLMTDVGDKICWCQVEKVGDRFNTLKNHQHNGVILSQTS